ncbi:MAG: hypothetical protein AAFO82_20435, partial [Bacteroidota bacterium]
MMRILLLLIFFSSSYIVYSQQLTVQLGHSDYVRSVSYSPNGRFLASASNDKTIKIWETSSGKLIRTLKGHSDYVRSVSYSPNG